MEPNTCFVKIIQRIFYAYVNDLSLLQEAIGIKISELKKDTYSEHEQIICSKISEMISKYSENPYFRFLCMEKYQPFLSKPGVTNAKDCLKESTVYGVLSAYKLFYVGCSRARKNLTIIIDQVKIKGDFEIQKNKFIETGFTIQ